MPIISIFFGIVIRMFHNEHPPCYQWRSSSEPTWMIKLIALAVTGPTSLRLSFSDGSFGEWDGQALFSAKPTLLTTPLLQPAEFARAFIENGALAWPNGLELAPWTLHAELAAAGKLGKRAA